MNLSCRLFVVVFVGFWLLLAYPAYLLAGSAGFQKCCLAAALCFVPAVGTCLWCALGKQVTPGQSLLRALAATVIRMSFTLAGGLLIALIWTSFQRMDFWIYLLVFYLFGLSLEIALLRTAPGRCDAPAKSPGQFS
jgi:hypothetical protein